MNAEQIAQNLDGKRFGQGYRCHCPSHADSKPSLDVEDKNGKTVFVCRSGCSQSEVIEGLRAKGLWGEKREPFQNRKPQQRIVDKKTTPILDARNYSRQFSTKAIRKEAARIMNRWLKQGYVLTSLSPYVDKDGKTALFKVRVDHPDGRKEIRPMKRNGSGWVIGEPNYPDDKKPLYRLPDLKTHPQEPVFVCEGEKACDALAGLSLVSTTSGSSSSAGTTDWSPLKKRDVIIWPDFDEPGQKYAQVVTEKLQSLGCNVQVFDVSGLGLPHKGDAFDYLELNPNATKADIESLPVVESVPVEPVSDDALNVESEAYPLPVSLSHQGPSPIPENVLSGWFGDMVQAVSNFSETPKELSMMLGLAALATCCQKRFNVLPFPGYKEPLNIWTVAALAPGNRKTSVLQAMTQPLYNWEKDRAEEVKEERARLSSERQTMEARIQHLRTKAGKSKDGDFESLRNEIAKLESELPDIPVIPRLTVQDVTPEKLGPMMAENDEKMSLLSDEGGIFDLLGGRYSGGSLNLDLFLQSHSGSQVRVDRGSRPPVQMDNPALSIGLSPQPEVLRALTDKPGFRGRGLLARFLFTVPNSLLGYRSLQSSPVPRSIADGYERGMRALLNIPVTPEPYSLKLSADALEEWRAFSRKVETGLREGGQFEQIGDWGAKLPGAAIRLAGLFHCSEYSSTRPWDYPISLETMNKALSLSAILSEHARFAFDLMGTDHDLPTAKRVWRWIERECKTSFSARDCFSGLKGHFKRMELLNPAIEVLVERHYIFPRDQNETQKRGRPSKQFIVNPTLSEGWK